MAYRFPQNTALGPGEVGRALASMKRRKWVARYRGDRFLYDTAWHWPRFVVRYRPWDWARDGL